LFSKISYSIEVKSVLITYLLILSNKEASLLRSAQEDHVIDGRLGENGVVLIANIVAKYFDIFFVRLTALPDIKVKTQVFATHNLRKIDLNLKGSAVVTDDAINASDDLFAFFFQKFVANWAI